MATFGSIDALRDAKADEWLTSAQQSTESWLRSMGWTGSKQEPEQPALSITLPTAEEYRASAPWRDLDPPETVTPSMPAAPVPSAIPGPDVSPESGMPIRSPGEMAPEVAVVRVPAAGAAAASTGDILDESSPAAFRQSLRNAAQVVADKYDLPPSIIAAIPIQETGFRVSRLGREGNNLFSIKGEGPAGSMQFSSGAAPEDLNTPFRKYNNAAESFDDFGRLITTQPRYARAVAVWKQTRDPAAFIKAVQEAGYATDWGDADGTGVPWWQKVINISKDLPTTVTASQPRQGAPAAMPEQASQAASSESLTPDQAALDDPDKWALCGPVAAVAMARSRGGNWTVAQAKAYAQQNGLWNADQGMGGLETEAKLLRGMGYAAQAAPLDWQKAAQDAATGNPVTLSTTFIPEGHYVVLERYDAKTGKFYVGGLGNTLKKTTGRSKWMSPAELESLGGIQGALHFDNPATPTPSVAAAPTAGAQPAPAAPPAAGPGVPLAGAGSEPAAPWANVGNFEGAALSAKAIDSELPPPGAAFPIDPRPAPVYDREGIERTNDSLTPIPGAPGGPWENPPAPHPDFEVAPGTMLRQPLGAQPELPASESYDPDAGPREGGRAGFEPSQASAEEEAGYAATPPQYNVQAVSGGPFPPEQYTEVATRPRPEPTPAPQVAEQAMPSGMLPVYDLAGNVTGYVRGVAEGVKRAATGLWDAAKEPQNAIDTAGAAAGAMGQAIVNEAYPTPEQQVANAGKLPMQRGIEVVQAALDAGGTEVGRRVGRAAGLTDEELFTAFGIPISGEDIAGFAGSAVLDPTNYIGAAPAARVGRAAIEAAAPGVRRAARALGEEGARQLMDLTPSPRMIQETGGGLPPAPRQTVEVLQEQLNIANRVFRQAREAGDEAAELAAREQAVTLEGALADARNTRLGLEPAITSDVGRRIETLPRSDESADAIADAMRPQERVTGPPPDISGPVSVPPNMAGRMNAAIPGFDPASAAAGGAAGAMSGEEGEEADPLKMAAGMLLGAVGSTPQGRRLVLRSARLAAKQAERSAPPNLLEILQNFRFSWGMLGNFSTGAVNAAGAPVEIAMGLPSEAFRMGVLHQRPAAVVYQAVEAASGLREGARSLLATAFGQIPQSVRDAPDFRPPLSERMQGRAGKAVGHAIELPGRLTSQAPDAFWRPVFERWGRAKAASDIMVENGASRIRPDEQVKEMHRLLHNPTPEEVARLDSATKKFADEQQYKGDAGYIEQALGSIVRPGNRIATSADPVAAQVHEALGSFVMPFFGTVWKIHKLAASRVPGIGMVTNRSLPLDEKISRQLVGAGLGIYLADRAAQGLITGAGPSDPDEAALVNKKMPPHSFYAPGVGWIPNDYAGSAGPYLNAIGGYYDARRYATEKERASADKMGDRIAKDVARGFERFPVAEAVKNVVAMFESPTKGVTDFLANAGSSLMPAPIKTAVASQDPYSRTIDRDTGFMDQLRQKGLNRAAVIPGVGSRQDLLPAQDRFGRPVENPRQGIAAFMPNIKSGKDDPLAQIFIDAKIQPGQAPAEIEGVPLTTAQKRSWLEARGQALASRQTALENALRLPEARREERIQAQLDYAAERAGMATRRLITPEQRAAAKKKAS